MVSVRMPQNNGTFQGSGAERPRMLKEQRDPRAKVNGKIPDSVLTPRRSQTPHLRHSGSPPHSSSVVGSRGRELTLLGAGRTGGHPLSPDFGAWPWR